MLGVPRNSSIVSENNCLVVEDSVIGLQVATGAGMQCVISPTYLSSTVNQDFKEAILICPDLSDVRLNKSIKREFQNSNINFLIYFCKMLWTQIHF